MSTPVFYIFSGLPASGKSTLAKLLAQKTGAMYVRIDTVEQGLRDLCNLDVEGEGYRLSYRIIQNNLKLGISCISDSCNTMEMTRREWQQVAEDVGTQYVNLEIYCSDRREHEQRVCTRQSEIPYLQLPDWQQVLNRDYDQWKTDVVRIDTAGQSVEASFAELCAKLGV